jgi:predicted DNA-binding transcriptional regulator AlpA
MDEKYYAMKQLFNIRIWSIDDVSLITGFSKGTIYNKTSKKEIPFRKRGKRLFFISDEIVNWIEEGEV